MSGCSYNKISERENVYYTQIQVAGIERIDVNGSNKIPVIRYKIVILNEKGDKKLILLDSDKQLNRGAFLRICYSDEKGVSDWEEVTENEIPTNVRKNLKIR